MRIHGIYWTREGIQPGEYIEAHEVDWKFDSDYTEVKREFDQRDDKYWPSILVAADVTNMTLVEEGRCPFDEDTSGDPTYGDRVL